MPNATSAMPAGKGTVPCFRVIYHEPICPDCGSFDITSDEVETCDGLTETALTCRDCGTAWPLACVTDWTVQP
jgi:uncharacterized Zn finger protein